MSEPEHITSAYTPDIEQVKSWLEKMVKSMRFVELVAAIIALIVRMRDVNSELLKQVTNLRKKRPRSETLKRLEQQLAFAFAGIIAKTPQRTEKPAQEQPKQSRRGRHPGRASFPPHLERKQEINPVPPELRICPKCGSEMATVAHRVCETLDIIPARLVVTQRLDETVACPHDDTIVSASPPPQIIDRGKLGTSIIVESLADKYLEHQPIERQCLKWERAGVEIAPQTLGRSVGAAIDLLDPIAKAINEQTREPGLLSTDATGLPVLDPAAPDGIRTGTIWCWINRQWVTFVYSPHGGAGSVRAFLGDVLRRTVQCDGTSITSFLERAGGRRPGCFGHARRRFVDAAKAGETLALDALRIIAQLFAVERASARAGDTHEQRLVRRHVHSRPIIDELRAWLDEHRGIIPPKTPLGRALGYLHRQWHRLCLFLEDGAIELTNNQVERELRRLVLGRKNWLFAWQDDGGERIASVLTIIGTCIAQGINPRPYLHVVTKRLLDGWPQARLRDLLPDRIAIDHPELRVPLRAHRAPALRDRRPPPLPPPSG
jgi:transposase